MEKFTKIRVQIDKFDDYYLVVSDKVENLQHQYISDKINDIQNYKELSEIITRQVNALK